LAKFRENSKTRFPHPVLPFRFQAKFLTWEIFDFTPCAHAQSNILHIKYADKNDD